jgi:copper chaperone
MRGIVGAVTETAVYSVPAMHCAHCERALREEISGLPAVSVVEVDLGRRLVTVVGEPLDDGAVRAAIEAAGYEVG